MPYANLQITVDPADKTAILQKVSEAISLMPYLINLTPKERHDIPKMGDKSVSFVNKSIEYANIHSNEIPASMPPADVQQDFDAHDELRIIRNAIGSLYESVDDTMMALGSEAFQGANAYYRIFKSAARMNRPGMDAVVEDLGQRYPGPKGDDEEGGE